jgi:hypothetical protein
MKLSSWVTHGLCVAFGVGVTTLVHRLINPETASSSSETSSLQPALSAELQDPANEPSKERQGPSLPAVTASASPAPATTQSRREPSAAEAKLTDGAERYAASFQPGVFGDEPMPDFAADYLLTSENDRAVEREQALDFAQLPIDGWAADMEQRIQLFLQYQPERSQLRISVNCRSSQCLVQLIERSGERRLSNALAARLSREPWFSENFHPVGTRGLTPNGIGDVHYARLVLSRRLQE